MYGRLIPLTRKGFIIAPKSAADNAATPPWVTRRLSYSAHIIKFMGYPASGSAPICPNGRNTLRDGVPVFAGRLGMKELKNGRLESRESDSRWKMQTVSC